MHDVYVSYIVFFLLVMYCYVCLKVFVPMADKTKRCAVTCNGNESVGTQ